MADAKKIMITLAPTEVIEGILWSLPIADIAKLLAINHDYLSFMWSILWQRVLNGFTTQVQYDQRGRSCCLHNLIRVLFPQVWHPGIPDIIPWGITSIVSVSLNLKSFQNRKPWRTLQQALALPSIQRLEVQDLLLQAELETFGPRSTTPSNLRDLRLVNCHNNNAHPNMPEVFVRMLRSVTHLETFVIEKEYYSQQMLDKMMQGFCHHRHSLKRLVIANRPSASLPGFRVFLEHESLSDILRPMWNGKDDPGSCFRLNEGVVVVPCIQ